MANPHPISHLTPDCSAKGVEAQRYTRKWFRQMLIDVVNGDITMTAVQLNALKTFADSKGWFPPQRAKINAVKEKARKPKAVVTDDLAQRLSTLYSGTITTESPHATSFVINTQHTQSPVTSEQPN